MNDEFNRKAQQLAKLTGKDVYYYVGPIEPLPIDRLIIALCNRKDYTENAYLIVTTNGGDPDSAYRLIRTFQTKYKSITMLIYGWCKSAGTLISLGVNEIAMSDMAELGPLDIQLIKDDELNANNRTSGNDLLQALSSLHGQAMAMYKSTFDELMNHSHGVLTTKTASEIAKNMVIGLLSPIYAQVEPTRMGAIARSNVIALSYGVRLGADVQVVNRLITNYPSHGFVIDRREAELLFSNTSVQVRALTPEEQTLGSGFEQMLRYPTNVAQSGLICCVPEAQNGTTEHSSDGNDDVDDGSQPDAGGAGDDTGPSLPVPRGSRKNRTV